MRLENNHIILERKSCYCLDGAKPRPYPCPACQGTGRGRRGKVDGCNKCHGDKLAHDHVNRATCDVCGGNFRDFQSETYCDCMPDGIFQALPFKVFRLNESQTLNEMYLGGDCVYSSTDYGNAWASADEVVIGRAKEERYVQATKVVDKNGKLADLIGIFIKPNGYSVKAIFNKG